MPRASLVFLLACVACSGKARSSSPPDAPDASAQDARPSQDALPLEDAVGSGDAVGSQDAFAAEDARPPLDASTSAAPDAGPPTPLHLLFLGNSYTYVNDLPNRVRALVVSSTGAPAITVDSFTVGGATLQTLYEMPAALTKVRMGGWTHVILQGQSVEPLLDPTTFQTYAKKFADEARAVGALPLFYETWARRAGDAVYQQTWSGGTPAAMQAGLRQQYRTAAEMGHGAVSPAGDAWELELAVPNPLNLYNPDGSHPSSNGTYLTGCVFYRALTMKSAVGLGAIPADVTSSAAAALQAIADRVAL